ncbi:hypothetical protein I3842_13G037200 [Carya illinoinensis]|uniref:Uncharacterized protein n=1 Tax=Carya illinoinensis TaxID=32201 RepID=A0A922DAE6_CARIL|nr:hypothetical protein I3842_13G037200 [Carya illinoinensis]
MSMSVADNGQEMQRPEGYPSGEEIEASTSNSESSSVRNWRFFATSNDLSLLESGLLQRDIDEFVYGINSNRFQEKLGKPLMDPKLVSVLEYFWELFVQKREVFMNIFPELLQHEVVKLLEKFETVIAQVKMDRTMKARVLQRSLSIDSPRPMSVGGDRDSPSKLEYFRIRTVSTDGGAPQGDDPKGTRGK